MSTVSPKAVADFFHKLCLSTQWILDIRMQLSHHYRIFYILIFWSCLIVPSVKCETEPVHWFFTSTAKARCKNASPQNLCQQPHWCRVWSCIFEGCKWWLYVIMHKTCFATLNSELFLCWLAVTPNACRDGRTGEYLHYLHCWPWIPYWAVRTGQREVNAVRLWYSSSFLYSWPKCGAGISVRSLMSLAQLLRLM